MAAVEKTTEAQGPDVRTGPVPTHEIVYRNLREMILFGELAPGQAVTIQGLTETMDAGMTPVREAIRRLTAEGALSFQGNRRVIVPRLTPENIEELIFARAAIEPQLIRLASAVATPEDLDQLERMDAMLDAAIVRGDVHGYLMYNHRFHERLYDLARAPILKELAMGMWLRFGPSLRVVCGRIGTTGVADQHKETLTAMRDGDAEGAAAAIRADVIQGMEVVRASLAEPD
jgi:DNA-binding GntR family transcriptional regulator